MLTSFIFIFQFILLLFISSSLLITAPTVAQFTPLGVQSCPRVVSACLTPAVQCTARVCSTTTTTTTSQNGPAATVCSSLLTCTTQLLNCLVAERQKIAASAVAELRLESKTIQQLKSDAAVEPCLAWALRSVTPAAADASPASNRDILSTILLDPAKITANVMCPFLAQVADASNRNNSFTSALGLLSSSKSCALPMLSQCPCPAYALAESVRLEAEQVRNKQRAVLDGMLDSSESRKTRRALKLTSLSSYRDSLVVVREHQLGDNSSSSSGGASCAEPRVGAVPAVLPPNYKPAYATASLFSSSSSTADLLATFVPPVRSACDACSLSPALAASLPESTRRLAEHHQLSALDAAWVSLAPATLVVARGVITSRQQSLASQVLYSSSPSSADMIANCSWRADGGVSSNFHKNFNNNFTCSVYPDSTNQYEKFPPFHKQLVKLSWCSRRASAAKTADQDDDEAIPSYYVFARHPRHGIIGAGGANSFAEQAQQRDQQKHFFNDAGETCINAEPITQTCSCHGRHSPSVAIPFLRVGSPSSSSSSINCSLELVFIVFCSSPLQVEVVAYPLPSQVRFTFNSASSSYFYSSSSFSSPASSSSPEVLYAGRIIGKIAFTSWLNTTDIAGDDNSANAAAGAAAVGDALAAASSEVHRRRSSNLASGENSVNFFASSFFFIAAPSHEPMQPANAISGLAVFAVLFAPLTATPSLALVSTALALASDCSATKSRYGLLGLRSLAPTSLFFTRTPEEEYADYGGALGFTVLVLMIGVVVGHGLAVAAWAAAQGWWFGSGAATGGGGGGDRATSERRARAAPYSGSGPLPVSAPARRAQQRAAAAAAVASEANQNQNNTDINTNNNTISATDNSNRNNNSSSPPPTAAAVATAAAPPATSAPPPSCLPCHALPWTAAQARLLFPLASAAFLVALTPVTTFLSIRALSTLDASGRGGASRDAIPVQDPPGDSAPAEVAAGAALGLVLSLLLWLLQFRAVYTVASENAFFHPQHSISMIDAKPSSEWRALESDSNSLFSSSNQNESGINNSNSNGNSADAATADCPELLFVEYSEENLKNFETKMGCIAGSPAFCPEGAWLCESADIRRVCQLPDPSIAPDFASAASFSDANQNRKKSGTIFLSKLPSSVRQKQRLQEMRRRPNATSSVAAMRQLHQQMNNNSRSRGDRGGDGNHCSSSSPFSIAAGGGAASSAPPPTTITTSVLDVATAAGSRAFPPAVVSPTNQEAEQNQEQEQHNEQNPQRQQQQQIEQNLEQQTQQSSSSITQLLCCCDCLLNLTMLGRTFRCLVRPFRLKYCFLGPTVALAVLFLTSILTALPAADVNCTGVLVIVVLLNAALVFLLFLTRPFRFTWMNFMAPLMCLMSTVAIATAASGSGESLLALFIALVVIIICIMVYSAVLAIVEETSWEPALVASHLGPLTKLYNSVLDASPSSALPGSSWRHLQQQQQIEMHNQNINDSHHHQQQGGDDEDDVEGVPMWDFIVSSNERNQQRRRRGGGGGGGSDDEVRVEEVGTHAGGGGGGGGLSYREAGVGGGGDGQSDDHRDGEGEDDEDDDDQFSFSSYGRNAISNDGGSAGAAAASIVPPLLRGPTVGGFSSIVRPFGAVNQQLQQQQQQQQQREGEEQYPADLIVIEDGDEEGVFSNNNNNNDNNNNDDNNNMINSSINDDDDFTAPHSVPATPAGAGGAALVVASGVGGGAGGGGGSGNFFLSVNSSGSRTTSAQTSARASQQAQQSQQQQQQQQQPRSGRRNSLSSLENSIVRVSGDVQE